MLGQYYLHENGKVIYKPHGGVQMDSSFVRKVWEASIIGKNPASFSLWLLELYNLKVDGSRIVELANHNNLFEYIPELKDEFIRLGMEV